MKRDDITFYSIYENDTEEHRQRISWLKTRLAELRTESKITRKALKTARILISESAGEEEVKFANANLIAAKRRHSEVMGQYNSIRETISSNSLILREGYRNECLHLSCEDCLRFGDCKFYRVPAGTVVLEGAKCGCIHYTSDGIHYPNERTMIQD